LSDLCFEPVQGASKDELAKTKSAYEAFLGSSDNLKAVRAKLEVSAGILNRVWYR
jgi:hypothetical protein